MCNRHFSDTLVTLGDSRLHFIGVGKKIISKFQNIFMVKYFGIFSELELCISREFHSRKSHSHSPGTAIPGEKVFFSHVLPTKVTRAAARRPKEKGACPSWSPPSPISIRRANSAPSSRPSQGSQYQLSYPTGRQDTRTRRIMLNFRDTYGV